MKTVYFLITDAGGAHRAIATALKQCLDDKGEMWDIRIINAYKSILNDHTEDFYNRSLEWGSARYYWPLMVPLGRLKLRLAKRRWLAQFKDYFGSHQPDLVVSFLPFINTELERGVRDVLPHAHFVTPLCDTVDLDDYYLVRQPAYDAHVHVICPSAIAAEQARALGYRVDQASQISGLPVSPDVYSQGPLDREAERIRHSLDPQRLTIMISFGSRGTPEIARIIDRLEQLQRAVQIIAVCGRNHRLEQRLAGLKTRYRLLVLGFTDRVLYYMHLSDIFIGKPGSMVYQAAIMGLSIICELNRHTMRQEVGNAQFVARQGLGMTINDFEQIVPAVTRLLDADTWSSYTKNLSAYKNRGVFEAAAALQRLLG